MDFRLRCGDFRLFFEPTNSNAICVKIVVAIQPRFKPKSRPLVNTYETFKAQNVLRVFPKRVCATAVMVDTLDASAKLRRQWPRRVLHFEYANDWELGPGGRRARA